MAILAQPILTGLTAGSLPNGMVNILGTMGGNAAHTGLVDITGTSNDASLLTNISTSVNFSVYLEQVLNYLDSNGLPCLLLPIVRSNSGGTQAYLLGNGGGGPQSFKFYSGNLTTQSFSGIGSGSTVSYIPKIGDTVAVFVLASGSNLYGYVWNANYGRPGNPQINVSDSTISSAGYAGLFASFNGDTADSSHSPTLTKFIVGTGYTYTPPSIGSGTATTCPITIAPPPVGGTAPFSFQVLSAATPGAPPSVMNPIAGASGSFANNSSPTQTITIPATSIPEYIRVKFTDSGSIPESIFTQEKPIITNGHYSFVFIGDSLTFGTFSTSGNDPVTLVQPMLSANFAPNGISVNNQGQGGSASIDWLPGASSGYLTTAVTAANTALATDVHLMLGTNDAREVVAPATFGANISSIISYLFSHVSTLKRVTLAKPPYITPQGAGGLYGEQSNFYLRQYATIIDGICDGDTILNGGDAYPGFAAFNNLSFSNIYQGDGVHLQNLGYSYLAAVWANGYFQSSYQKLIGLLKPSLPTGYAVVVRPFVFSNVSYHMGDIINQPLYTEIAVDPYYKRFVTRLGSA